LGAFKAYLNAERDDFFTKKAGFLNQKSKSLKHITLCFSVNNNTKRIVSLFTYTKIRQSKTDKNGCAL